MRLPPHVQWQEELKALERAEWQEQVSKAELDARIRLLKLKQRIRARKRKGK